MSSSQYRSLGETLKELEISFREDNFMQEIPFAIPDYFLTDLEFMLNEGVVDNSEYAICENLIYPILKEVWKPLAKKFTLWSHQYLNYTSNLTGFPEYILARRSPLGKVVFDKPYFLLRDIFTRNKIFYSIQELEHLFAAVNFVFQACDRQLQHIAI